MAIGPDVPYVEQSPPEVFEQLKRSLAWEGEGSARVLSWTCPICTHAQNLDVDLEGRIVALDRLADGPDEPRRGKLTLICDCGHPHEGRPDDAGGDGCGFAAKVPVTLT